MLIEYKTEHNTVTIMQKSMVNILHTDTKDVVKTFPILLL